MKRKNRSRVLAIGLDAAEPALVRRLIEAGELPVLKRLMAEGTWSNVLSPAPLGSGTVWPTFFTGASPAEHGVYSEWCWQPETMRLTRHDGSRLKPFWKRLADDGRRVGVLDVPFAPLVGLGEGFEIVEWGAHDAFEGRMTFGPEKLSDLLLNEAEPHPFSLDGMSAVDPHAYESLGRLSSACLRGVKLRGELAARLIAETDPEFSLIVFPEIHHASHKLWHSVEADSSMYTRDEAERAQRVEPGLHDILREVDRQVGRLIETVGADAHVLVFSLHGMKPAKGLPAFLGPLLCAHGQASTSSWATQSWRERASSLLAAMKRRAPAPLKKIYHRSLPQEVTHRLAQPTMLPSYDWERTRAFALPSDQHGWIRLNLEGREAKGVVPLESYREACLEIEGMLLRLLTEDERPLVRRVIHTAGRVEDARSLPIPDLVVHWHDAAFELPMKLHGLLLEAHPAARLTGQHAPDGFLIFRGPKELARETVSAAELQLIIGKALTDY
jgi:predicted AlkP superfamily phosphohydrolase/phosphomutase